MPTSCRSPVPSLGFLPLYSTLASLRASGASSLRVRLLNEELFHCSYWQDPTEVWDLAKSLYSQPHIGIKELEGAPGFLAFGG